MLKRDFIAFTATGVNPSMIETPSSRALATLFRLPETHLTLHALRKLLPTAENFQRAGYVHRDITAADNNAFCGMLISPCACLARCKK